MSATESIVPFLFCLQAAARAGSMFPFLADRAEARAEDCREFDRLVDLPDANEAGPFIEGLAPSIDVDRPSSVEDVTTIINLPEPPVPSQDDQGTPEDAGDQP